MKMSAGKRTNGFTLVEMLIVLALIGILGSMLTVIIIRTRKLSRLLECKNNLREIGTALNQAALGAGGAYPQLEDENGIPWWANVYKQWGGAPLDTDADPSNGLQLPAYLPRMMQTFHCTNGGALNLNNLGNSISYGLNFDVMDSDRYHYHASDHADPYSARFPGSLTSGDKQADRYYFTQVIEPSEFILVSEADTQDPDPANWTGGRISMSTIARDAADDPPDNAPIVGRHNGRANVLFADLHVEAMEVVEGVHGVRNLNDRTPFWTLPAD